ncbi:MAG TPA: DNA repair protein RecO [Bacteroidetes bacterium]|nr:DNA repair protein RecO [Bacteroidota bacterium]
MLTKTRGIVLQQIKYGDSSLIVHIYTENHGRLAFMIKGFGKKSGFSRAFFQPLTLLDLNIYFKPARNLQIIKESHINHPFLTIYGDIQKTGITLFLSEVLTKTIPEEESNTGLFFYLYDAIRYLDEKEYISNYFHLFFLVRLTRFLGISPVNYFSKNNQILDMREGTFISTIPSHQDFMDKENASFFSSLLDISIEQLDTLPAIAGGKYDFLEKILQYYRIHLEGMGKIKSLDILHDVFR